MNEPQAPSLYAALDNDVVLKAACYGLTDRFWPEAYDVRVGVLGTARFVVPTYVERAHLRKDPAEALAHLDRVLARAERLEPSEQELELAVELERAGQLAGLALEGGESMLCAITLLRGVPWLHTGDKRAIKSIEALADSLAARMGGRMRCLEQLALGALSPPEQYPQLARAICAEPAVDKTLSICFSCFAEEHASRDAAREALENYIAALRAGAPRVLSTEA